MRPRRPGSSRARTGAIARTQYLQLLSTNLDRMLTPGVSVRIDQWVSTPEGEQSVDLVLQRSDRRIGLVIGHPYEQETETLDALRLVYGGFDVLYRVSGIESSRSCADVLLAIVCEKSGWFTEAGRVEAGRRASERVLLGIGGDDRPVQPSSGACGIGIRRMRLSRANEWVEAFERALGPTRRRVA